MRLFVPQEEVKMSVLDNGLRIATVKLPGVYTVSVAAFVNVGSRSETDECMGISHFIEHMLFKGSERYSQLDISQLIEGKGGQLNAFTSEEQTCYYLKTFPDEFDSALDVLSDMLQRPLFNPEEIDKEKDVIVEEIHSYEDQPSSYVGDLFSQVFWQGHPLGHWIYGTEKSVRDINQKKLFDFFNTHYTAPNTLIAVSGDVEHDEMVSKLKASFCTMPEKAPPNFIAAPAIPERGYSKILPRDLEQCHLQFGLQVCDRYHPDRMPLRLLSTLIGENMSSDLFQEIREKRGLAYHIQSAVDFYEDTGIFAVTSSVEKGDVEECVEASIAILRKYTEKTLTTEQLIRAKRYVFGQVLQEMENTLSAALIVGDKLLSRETEFSLKSFYEEVMSVTEEEVRVCAKRYFTNPMHFVLIGPYHPTQRFEKLLTL